jgi:putative hydrolase of the HAD superfamily
VPERRIDAVIFDLDNTLTDFMQAKENSIRAAVAAMVDTGLPVGQDEATRRVFAIYRDKGIEHQRVFNVFLQEVLGAVDDRILAAAVVAYRRARDGSLVLYPHSHLVLNRLLKDGYKLAMVSDAPRFEAWLRLCYLGLHHHFDLVLTYDDTGHRKPSPEPFLIALDRLAVAPDRAVMVGDWPERDIAGGKEVGLHTVYARYGDKKYEFGARTEWGPSGADYEIDDLLELLTVLDELNGRRGRSAGTTGVAGAGGETTGAGTTGTDGGSGADDGAGEE